MGGHVEACEACGQCASPITAVVAALSQVTGRAARTGLAERQANLLPVGYFHVVFTFPAEVGVIAVQDKTLVSHLLFGVGDDAAPRRRSQAFRRMATLRSFFRTRPLKQIDKKQAGLF